MQRRGLQYFFALLKLRAVASRTRFAGAHGPPPTVVAPPPSPRRFGVLPQGRSSAPKPAAMIQRRVVHSSPQPVAFVPHVRRHQRACLALAEPRHTTPRLDHLTLPQPLPHGGFAQRLATSATLGSSRGQAPSLVPRSSQARARSHFNTLAFGGGCRRPFSRSSFTRSLMDSMDSTALSWRSAV